MVKLIKIKISHLTTVAARPLMLYDGSKYPKLRFISNVQFSVRLIIFVALFNVHRKMRRKQPLKPLETGWTTRYTYRRSLYNSMNAEEIYLIGVLAFAIVSNTHTLGII